MTNILSKEEVNSLLSGIEGGEVATETSIFENNSGLPAYDFSKNHRPDYLRMPALGIINERFINLLNSSIFKALGSIVDFSVSEIASEPFGDFCKSLPLPSSLNIYKMDPLKGSGILVLEGSLVFTFVDLFFGGKCSGNIEAEDRRFTAIERKIIDRIVGIVLEDLERAWSEVQEMEMVCTRSEIDPQYIGIAKPNDILIVTRFRVDFGNHEGIMTICLPYATLEPIQEKLFDDYQSEKPEVDKSWRPHMENKIKEISVNLKCIVGSTKITGRELLGMQIDDIIITDQKVESPVPVTVENLPKFKGYPGVLNSKKAVKIED